MPYTRFSSSRIALALAITSVLSLSGCGAPPVPVSECDSVVKHIKTVLKDKAPSSSALAKQCKEATDEQRGCAMAADKPMKLMKCM